MYHNEAQNYVLEWMVLFFVDKNDRKRKKKDT